MSGFTGDTAHEIPQRSEAREEVVDENVATSIEEPPLRDVEILWNVEPIGEENIEDVCASPREMVEYPSSRKSSISVDEPARVADVQEAVEVVEERIQENPVVVAAVEEKSSKILSPTCSARLRT